ncbi:hypothetical protein [Bacillus norwichensis]|uniref:Uncharacterized protein n=1 Tax=Bacillus norwichensis TaxID=2762217 RepID=A0ABR8VJD2_9BACI|nr:hypothetical protein [Bacillus norwichensis]MBD8004865.1 hypothetical protein [Bacillus norwichensis]
MLNKWLIVGGAVILLLGFLVTYTFEHRENSRDKWTEEEFIHIVNKYYMDSSGKIKSYGTVGNEEYLLESMGLYMEWLSEHNRNKEIEKLVQTVQNEFVFYDSDETFLSWRIEKGKKESANAWIDDARILSVLGPGHPLFKDITEGLIKHQIKDGLIMDFYDWKQKAASERVVLSYGTIQNDWLPLEKMDDLYVEVSTMGAPFYPEYYSIIEKSFIKLDEVHMVDQLLIATELEKKELNNDEFWQWLKSEWKQHHLIAGRYDRSSKNGKGIESAAVYRIAAGLASLKGEDKLSEKWKDRGLQLVNQKDLKFDDIHFFDLISNAP